MIQLKGHIGTGGIFSATIRAKQYLNAELREIFVSKNGKVFKCSNISHVELCFDASEKNIKKIKDNKIQIEDNSCEWENIETYYKKYGIAYSSSERDKGTRFKIIEWKPENWITIDLDLTEEQEELVLDYCIKNEGKPYGLINLIFSQAFPFPINTKFSTNQFCSQICKNAILTAIRDSNIEEKHIHLFPENGRFDSPAELFYNLTK